MKFSVYCALNEVDSTEVKIGVVEWNPFRWTEGGQPDAAVRSVKDLGVKCAIFEVKSGCLNSIYRVQSPRDEIKKNLDDGCTNPVCAACSQCE